MKKIKTIVTGILYWIIQLTWGAIMTIPGLIITGIAILCGGKPHKNGFSYIVEIGGNWGGLELGAVALCGNYTTLCPSFYEHVRRHEFGHSVQQLMFGPLQPFIVGIPSVIRYWYQRFMQKVGNGAMFDNDWYDSIWFEGTATKWGTIWIDKIEKNKKMLR